MCGTTFSPTTSRQKVCIACKDEANKLRRKQRYREKIQAKGGNTGYSEKECKICGNIYKTNSSSQKYCEHCKSIGLEILKRSWYIKKKQIYQENKKQKVLKSA